MNSDALRQSTRRASRPASLVAVGIVAAVTDQSVQSVASAAGATAPIPLRFDVTLNLSRLHPAAATGAIECGALEQTRNWVEANRGGLVDYASVQRLVLNQAHYFGQYARVSFPVTGRAYSGTQTFTTSLSVQAQVDPSTHVQYQTPAVLIACWLSINGQPALWDQARGLQVLSSNNFTSVNENPLVTAVGDAYASIALTAQLSVQGTVFAPAPVALSTSLQVQGPMSTARSATGTPSPTSSMPAPDVPSAATIARVNAQRKALAARLPQLVAQLNPGRRAPPMVSVAALPSGVQSAVQSGAVTPGGSALPVANALPPPAADATLPAPTITQVITQGDPGAGFEIDGLNLVGPNPSPTIGDVITEVHFFLGALYPEQVITVPQGAGFLKNPSDDHHLITLMPDGYTGMTLAGSDGYVYVKRLDGQVSNHVALHFRPVIDCTYLPLPPTNADDSKLNYASGGDPGLPPGWSKIAHPDLYNRVFVNDLQVFETTGIPYLGFKGDDYLYGSSRLLNGWTLADAGIINMADIGNATVTGSGLGTATPFLKVHVWTDAGNSYVKYQPWLVVCGPAGVPYDSPYHSASSP